MSVARLCVCQVAHPGSECLSSSRMEPPHVWRWWSGESIDQESWISHLAHAAFWIFALLGWEKTHPEHDDRPRTVAERKAELEIDEAFARIAEETCRERKA